MKYKLLRFSLLSMLVMLFGGLSLAAILDTENSEKSETLTPSTKTGYEELTVIKAGTSSTGSELEISKGNIVVTSNLGYIKDHEMTVYKNGSMTIGFKEGIDAHITKVELTVRNYHFSKPEGWTSVYTNDVTTKFDSSDETETFTTDATDKTSLTISNAASGKTTIKAITVYYVNDSAGGNDPEEEESIANPYTYTFEAKVFDSMDQTIKLAGASWTLNMTCNIEDS